MIALDEVERWRKRYDLVCEGISREKEKKKRE